MATVNETATEKTANSQNMPVLEYEGRLNFSKGPAVAYLQYLLTSYNYGEILGPSGVNGNYSLTTKTAVTKFQEDRNKVSDVNPPQLVVDGIVGRDTWRALGDNFYRTCKTSAGNPPAELNLSDDTSNDADLPRLKIDSKGEAVRFLQQLLLGYTEITGYTNDSFDAVFGPETQRGVIAFQKSKQLQQDGVVGKDTWTELFKGSRERCNGTVS